MAIISDPLEALAEVRSAFGPGPPKQGPKRTIQKHPRSTTAPIAPFWACVHACVGGHLTQHFGTLSESAVQISTQRRNKFDLAISITTCVQSPTHQHHPSLSHILTGLRRLFLRLSLNSVVQIRHLGFQNGQHF